jgi:pimeloyl-ACP methyl ester carboxylesterase
MIERTAQAANGGVPTLRRAYFDCRFGQLHVYQAIPAGGGFDEQTAALCVPGAPGSAGIFQPLLPLLGADRSVYAVDLPGSGLSDAPPAGSGAAEQAAALGDFLKDMRIRRVCVLAQGDGAGTAFALAARLPAQIACVALWAAGRTAGAGPEGLRVVNVEAADTAQLHRQLLAAFAHG